MCKIQFVHDINAKINHLLLYLIFCHYLLILEWN